MSKEPIGLSAGSNLFAYALGDPVNLVDKDGHFAAAVGVVIVGAAIVVTGIAIWAILEGHQDALKKIEKAFPANDNGDDSGMECEKISEDITDNTCTYFCPNGSFQTIPRWTIEDECAPSSDVCEPTLVFGM